MKFKDVADMSKEDVAACLVSCREFIGSHNEGDKLDIKLSDHVDALRKRSLKLEMCPECFADMAWDYSVNRANATVTGFLKCLRCKHKEVI